MKTFNRFLLNALGSIITQNAPKNLAIEVCTACNHRCVYCPVYEAPFRQKVMSMDNYILILNKLMTIPGIRNIALNHYNEPFMDPIIIERVRAVFDRKMTRWLILYTNGSMIKTHHLKAFHSYRKQLGFNINLPTVISKERYREVHGRDDLDKVETCLQQLINDGFLVQINVQDNQHTTEEDFQSVLEKYGKKVKKIRWITSSTRSNAILDEQYSHQGKIVGCTLYRHTNYLHIGITGDVFLCAEDYHRKSQFGNILKESLDEILRAAQRKKYLDYLSGQAEAPDDFICRSCKHAVTEEMISKTPGVNGWLKEMLTSNNLFNRF